MKPRPPVIPSEDHIDGRSGKSGCGDAQIRVAGHGGGGESGRGADQHDAFEAQIDDARSFADNFAERRIEE
jgi:hypothetical protein